MRKLHIPGRSNVIGMNGLAATSQPLSSLEAINILKKGGNAIDAAIAASAVQSVIEPNSTGIGGDCFALIALIRLIILIIRRSEGLYNYCFTAQRYTCECGGSHTCRNIFRKLYKRSSKKRDNNDDLTPNNQTNKHGKYITAS